LRRERSREGLLIRFPVPRIGAGLKLLKRLKYSLDKGVTLLLNTQKLEAEAREGVKREIKLRKGSRIRSIGIVLSSKSGRILQAGKSKGLEMGGNRE